METKKPPDAAAFLGFYEMSKILRSRRYVGDVIKIHEGCGHLGHAILNARSSAESQAQVSKWTALALAHA
ncbi:hypothetical protein ABLO27_08995 [Roseibium sp. SCPC15]|uniref:hypothetical protein n=1 Tax=Roseibium sp. SCP15 TaxID=3141376 RepID=UPI0033362E4D